MLVTMLAIASVLLVPIILVLLSLNRLLQSKTIRRESQVMIVAPPALLSITEAFDPIYSVLWEAPIAALELIDSAGSEGLFPFRLRPIYRRAASRFPEIYDGCSFPQWLQFLASTRLIAWQGCKLVLTHDAQTFLQFRFVTDVITTS